MLSLLSETNQTRMHTLTHTHRQLQTILIRTQSKPGREDEEQLSKCSLVHVTHVVILVIGG